MSIYIYIMITYPEYFSNDFRFLFDSVDEPIFILPYSEDLNENFFAVNKAATKIYEYSEDEFLKLKIKDLMYFPENIILPFNGEILHFWHKKKNGEKFPVEVKVEKFSLNNKNFLIFFVRDISIHKECVENIQKNELKFRAIFYSTPDAVVLLNIDTGKIVDVNKSFTRHTGYLRDEVIGKDFLSLDIIATPEDRRKFLHSFGEEDILINFELSYRDKEGRVFPGLFAASFFKMENETCMLLSFRNISELKKHEVELKRVVEERTKELVKINEELEAFSYTISHDLKSPLRAIDGFSKILQEDYRGKLDKEADRLLNIIRDNSQKMIKLINDLMNFSKITKVPLNRQKINLTAIAKSIYNELIPEKDKDRVKFYIDNLPEAYADPNLIKQVFYNLISNAIKFSLKKDEPVIKIGFIQKDNEIIYFVKDNGIGFNMQYSNKLFKIFQRLHSEKEYSGTGVGLSIVERIISRHGGKIWAKSTLNQETIFYFTIPLK